MKTLYYEAVGFLLEIVLFAFDFSILVLLGALHYDFAIATRTKLDVKILWCAKKKQTNKKEINERESEDEYEPTKWE